MLIVEDDKYFLRRLSQKCEVYGDVVTAQTFDLANELLGKGGFNAAFIDLHLQGEDLGLRLVEKAVSNNITPFVITGYDSKEMIAKAYDLGAKHYFSKMDFKDELEAIVGPYLETLNRENLAGFFKNEFVTEDQDLIKKISYFQHITLGVGQRILLTGPTGVGKGVIAKLIHKMAGGTEVNFVHVNASELPDLLAESLLFGHKKGAFTNAHNDKEGFFTKANGGTLFLDEIGTISIALQKKLLTAIESGQYTPLGATRPLKSKFQLITATCEDLGHLISEGEFRPDFYFRLKGVEVDIPPLKERKGDIELLIDHFLRQFPRKIVFSELALKALRDYDWFGNIRELEHLITKLAQGDLGVIKRVDLPVNIITNTNPFPNHKRKTLYSSDIAEYIKDYGLNKLIEEISLLAFEDAYRKNEGKITRVRKHLQISVGGTYKIQEMVKQRQGGYLKGSKDA